MDKRDLDLKRLSKRVKVLEEMLVDLGAYLRYFPESDIEIDKCPSRNYWYKIE